MSLLRPFLFATLAVLLLLSAVSASSSISDSELDSELDRVAHLLVSAADPVPAPAPSPVAGSAKSNAAQAKVDRAKKAVTQKASAAEVTRIAAGTAAHRHCMPCYCPQASTLALLCALYRCGRLAACLPVCELTLY